MTNQEPQVPENARDDARGALPQADGDGGRSALPDDALEQASGGTGTVRGGGGSFGGGGASGSW